VAESIIQSSFAAGELSQNLFARVDLDKYHTGAALMRNFFVDYRGGASYRVGTEMIDRTKSSTYAARLVPFIFSQSQSYVLELGDHYMRFYQNGEQLLNASQNILGITNANPGVVNVTAHGYTTGTSVFLNGIGGMTSLNAQTYLVVNIDANHFSLTDLDGNPINTALLPAYTSGGTVASVYEIATPWAAVDLRLLKFTQSADVMTFTHNLYPIQNLSRTGPGVFSLSPEVIGPPLPAPTGLIASSSVAGTLIYQYIVVAVDSKGVRGAQPNSVFAASKALDPLATTPVFIEIGWLPVTGADHYDVFKTGPVPNSATEQPTVFGYIGSSAGTSIHFNDNNIAPNYADNPPQFRDPFASSNYPGCVTYFQQRRVYGNLVTSPEEMDFSKTGAYSTFDTSFASLDSDAIQIAIASQQVNEIRSMVPTSTGLVVLTSGGAFLVSGGTPQAAVSPSNIVALPQASTGANDLPPIRVNYDILFVQNKGSIVRDFAFNFYTQSYYGYDRSALSNHLFFGYQLLEWAWAEEPFKIIWVVRDDGKLLSLTYVPEQEVYGWAQHDTQGVFESVCVVPEGQEDAVYLVVRRQFGQKLVRYVERMASRKFVRVEDAWFVDCGVGTSLPRPGFGFSVVATGNVPGAVATLTADAGTPFSSTWIGQIIWLDSGGKLKVTASADSTHLTATILQPLGDILPGGQSNDFAPVVAGAWEYGPQFTTFGGLQHLAGHPVMILADGSALEPQVVSSSGTVTLPTPCSKCVAGLGFQGQLQSLYLDIGDPTIQGKRKKISAITVRMDKTRGLKLGETFDGLVPMKEIPPTGYSAPLPLISEDRRVNIINGWNEPAQMCVQQDWPLPATVLGLIPEVTFGDTGR
jgi:hypothetical protein